MTSSTKAHQRHYLCR